jgi:hypothetical protein
MRKVMPWAVLCTVIAFSCHAQSQTPSDCPSRSGVYALKDSSWVEVPTARAKKEKARTGFPFHGIIIAVYSDQSSSLSLANNVSFCASGVALGTTFFLGRTNEKKDSREIKVATYSALRSAYSFDIDKKQAVAIDQKRDAKGNFILQSKQLASGQYLLFMQQGTSLSSIPPAFDFHIR